MKKTNKTFKRFAAITSASLLAACAMVPVFTSMTSYAAAGKITFKNGTEAETTNTYKAYKIFTGVAVENGFGKKAVMSNIAWNATDTDAAAILTALKNDARFNTTPAATAEIPNPAPVNDFANCETAEDVAGVLAGYAYDGSKANAFAEVMMANAAKFGTPATSNAGEIILSNDTDDGYYVIAQTSPTTGLTTEYLLGVYDNAEGAEVSVKVSQPTFEKKIKDINDSASATVNAAENWQDSADYDIGDAVPFQLSATLPSNYNEYNEFKLVFHDDLRAKMVDETPVEVYGAPKSVKAYYDKNGDGKYAASDGDSSFEGIAATTGEDNGCQFEFVFDNLKAMVPEAVVGSKIIVEYTAELLDTAVIGSAGNWNEASLEYSNNPYYTSTPDTNNTIDNDGDGDSTDDDNTETTSKTEKDQVVAFTYKTVIDKITKDGAPLAGATFKLEKKVPKTEGEGYNLVTITQVETTPTSTFTFNGIDDGDYVLTEVSTPGAQYNSIAPIEFTVSATHDKNSATPTLTVLDVDVKEGDAELKASLSGGEITKTNGEKHVAVSGEIYTEIVNSTGLELPGTGGIGTTIFYLGGGAMAAIGGIYLISKRRMRKSEE